MPGPALSLGPDDYSPEEAVLYVSLTLVNNYVLYATAALLVYELFTSLDDEVAYVWPLKWRLPKILFILNRYIIRAMLVCLWIVADYPGTSAEFCRIYSYWQMIPLRLAILAAQALVGMRVWAIYNNSRQMFWILAGIYTLEFAAVTACIVVATIDTQGASQPPPLSCALNSRSGYLLQRYASATWIAPVCFEFVMVLITLPKIVPFSRCGWAWRRRPRGFPLGPGSGGNATLAILARDSLIYFFLIFTFSLANAVIYELSFSTYYHSILLAPTSAISCIAVSRMMINIRSVPVDQPSTTSGAYARPDFSLSISFADPSCLSSQAKAESRLARSYTSGSRAEDRPHSGASGGEYGSVPDTARTPYFNYANDGVEAASPITRPGSAWTSGDVTPVWDTDFDDSMIEMQMRKVLSGS
ncbi:hypothetical protein K438DRAFT_1932609 [Mycena galopus ATCC 62051]|nr:hypothetical protein K438DRAFT_1932609 [Mycena galopus ATCC 62051]